MSRGKELIKNTAILMVARISTQIVSFLLLPLYTALLSKKEYGRIDIYTSLIMIIVPLLTMQLEMGMFRFYITKKNLLERKIVISSSIAMITVIVIGASVFYFPLAILLDLQYKYLLYGYYAGQIICTVLYQVCRAKGDNIGYAVASFTTSTITVFLNVIFIALLHLNVEGILLSSIIAHVIGAGYMTIREKWYREFEFAFMDKDTCKELLSYSTPLVFNQIFSWAINYSDRIIILLFWGEGTNGIYSVANKFSNILNTFFGVYNIAWTENIIRSLDDKNNKEYVSKVFELTFNIYFILITGIMNVLPFVFSYLVNITFSDAYLHIPILLVAMLFSGMAATLGSIYIAFKKTKNVSITTTLAGVCNVLVHFSLLDLCRLYAASISTLVSFSILFIYRYVFMQKFYKLQFHMNTVIARMIIMIISWIAYSLKNDLFVAFCFVINIISICCLYLNNKEMINNLIYSKRKR